MPNDDFRLSANPPSWYLELFDAAKFRIIESEAVLGIGDEADDTHFEVYVDVEDNSLPEEVYKRARLAISHIVEMDSRARLIDGRWEHNEHLGFIKLDKNEVRLRYWATSVNTEWDVVFKFDDQDQLTCLGIPDWQNPGSYISQ